MDLKKMSVGLFSVLLLVSCGGKQDAKQEAPASVYPTLVLSAQNAQLETVYPVTIKGQEDIEIRPRIDGFIEAIYVDEGSVVRKGQTLFKINSPSSEQALSSAKAAVNSAQASVNTAKLNVDRIRPLAEKGIVSKVQLETNENVYQSSLATLAQSQATLAQAQATMSWTNVTSPVDGIVGEIPYRQGSLVDKANALTTVANTSNVYAYFSLNEKDLLGFLSNAEGKTQAEKIKNMPEVTLILADGSVYPEKGKIETISGVVNVSTGSAGFRAEFPNPHGLLRSGASGKVSIPRHLDNVYVIPQKATFSQQDKVLVYKVEGDSVMQSLITVSVMPDGKSYAVTSGLKDGDRIVTDGVATLSNGKKIKIENQQ
ncbi:efflux RND transporter periplasmic adaptor subunit [Dysgonomonas macrotermitis]|uniref:Membrane fusion protein, multidrug efflux system n=1 Tax=Dysgonomonas macrotermitis TaxID=1346286 RepID=A0A1M4YJB2_9BACT|nr:efflux RND transporter periplasmic adaptor subunit [Dysgonomonas macrotermitis]SHF05562.1 membrane fusion protein, multidrug efflux system [Dysgonomonas macrotermitis]